MIGTVRGSVRIAGLLLWTLLSVPIAALLIGIASLFGERSRYRVITVVTKPFCLVAARAMGVRVKEVGQRSGEALLFAANHVSFLDILVIGATVSGVFVSRHDLRGWPVIGIIARIAGTVFLDRGSLRSALESADAIVERIGQGIRVAFFPEGRTSDGLDVQPFKAFLFGGVARAGLSVQPVAIRYEKIGRREATAEEKDRLYWYGEEASLSSIAWHIMGLPSVTAVVHYGEDRVPPSLEDPKESARALAENLREDVRELRRS